MHAYSAESRVPVLGVLASIAVVVAIVTNRVLEECHFEYGWLVSAPTVGGAFAILLAVFDKWAWRWKWLHVLKAISTPVIEGKYEGILRSTWDGAPDVQVRVLIEQRWLRILIRFEVLESETSKSKSVTAAVYGLGHHDASLTYTYSNRIRPGFADDDMSDHDGMADVTIDQHGRLEGRYFNARGRQGTLALQRR